MAKLKKNQGRERTFEIPELAPEGTYVAICKDARDRFGVQRLVYMSKTEYETLDTTTFLFEFTGRDGRPYQVASPDMRMSLHENARLTEFLHAWLGKSPLDDFDTDVMKGRPAMITVEHKKGGKGRVYAAIVTISPVPDGMAPPVRPGGASSTSAVMDDDTWS